MRSTIPGGGASISASQPRSGTDAAGRLHLDHVWQGHSEQRAASLCHGRWHECARQQGPQLSAPLEWRAKPRAAGNPTQPQDWRVSLDPLRWGLIPYWCQDPTGGRKPINAKCETVHSLPTFREAYRNRRCILPVDGFFEWKAIKGKKAKQPYAIAMKDGAPFGIAGIWENWKQPASGEWIRTFAIITHRRQRARRPDS